MHGRIVDARAQAGCTPQVSQRVIRRDTTVSLVGAGLGVSPVPASPREDRRKMVVYRDIDAPGTPVSYEPASARRRGDRSPSLEVFRESAFGASGRRISNAIEADSRCRRIPTRMRNQSAA
ncbi:LysR substrate-binding domain-containing protein [Burkholderia savannae]|uniref:LysR substrate-binding domain-containing protein n=1 Tax=Burkholderia savannae TaxID=1637837 RepID=UPI0018D21350|nr:LysR substrate-binding domain-containing protein [Burkholderia savannae]